MSDRQYFILLDLYHEYNEAFVSLAEPIRYTFFMRLSERGK